MRNITVSRFTKQSTVYRSCIPTLALLGKNQPKPSEFSGNDSPVENLQVIAWDILQIVAAKQNLDIVHWSIKQLKRNNMRHTLFAGSWLCLMSASILHSSSILAASSRPATRQATHNSKNQISNKDRYSDPIFVAKTNRVRLTILYTTKIFGIFPRYA